MVVDTVNVLGDYSAVDEGLLLREDKLVEIFHYVASDGCSYDTVVCVGN